MQPEAGECHASTSADQNDVDLLKPWLMPEGSIKGLPCKAVEHARMWAQNYAALQTVALGMKVKSLVEGMCRSWQRSTNTFSLIFEVHDGPAAA
jgi:hypothetical protein